MAYHTTMATALSRLKYSCQRKIHTYRERHEDYLKREEELVKRHGKVKYNQMIKRTATHVKTLSTKIDKINTTQNKIKALANAVATYMGYELRDSGKFHSACKKHERLVLAKQIFYKYGLEHNIKAVDLIDFINTKLTDQARQFRLRLNRRITTEPEIRELWEGFKKHYESYLSNPTDFVDARTVTA